MRLFERAMIDELSDLIENDISVVAIGDLRVSLRR